MHDFSSTRRDALKVVAGTAGLALAGLPLFASSGERAALIRAENARPGTRDWMLAKTGVDAATKYRCPRIEGYCSQASVKAGETIQFCVSTNPPSPFTIEVYRLGWYGGDGGRLMHRIGPVAGTVQTDPPMGAKRLRNCEWSSAAELIIPNDWLSGVYVGKLTAERDGWQSYVTFVVRDDRRADFLFQVSDFTWQAYNRWPNQFALYDDGEHEWYWGGDVQVSFNRPYGKYCQILDAPLSTGSGEYFLWEFPLAFWMESQGYDVSYISNLDTHRDGPGLTRARGLLSVGHDEYWTIEMFENVQAAVRAGVSVGFFSGNAVCGRVVYDERTRSIERVGVFGPAGGMRDFEHMKTLEHKRPYANELVGAHSTGPVTGGADWICTAPEHWIYKGTGMRAGDQIPVLTRLIGRVDAGENGAQAELCELVYGELRDVARRLRRRSNNDSLATTDVVHEFVGRLLADQRLGQMKNRRYFYSAATDQMRRLLIDHWRHKKAQKRGGDLHRENLDPWLDQLVDSTATRCGGDLEALDAALAQLQQDRPRQYEIIQLKFFAGLTNDEVAETLDISVDTVKRDWKVARARLGALLSDSL